MIKQFLDAMNNDMEYDFIANNYTSMSKSELKDILLEYIYAVHNSSSNNEISDNVSGELESNEVFG